MKSTLVTIITLFFIQGACTQSIIVTGQWNYTIPTTDITEAGEDFTGKYTSSVNQVYLDIIYDNKWSVSVQKNNIAWDDNIIIWMHRTGNGNGTGKINGGQNYKKIKNNNAKFITGEENRNSIPIQYQMRNVSVTIPAHNYVVEIMFTLTAT